MDNIEASGSAAHICGIVVTYRPEEKALRRLLQTVRPQLQSLVIVDNGSTGFDFEALRSTTSFELIALGENYGIAHAQNIGIDRARRLEASHVLLLDQDSVPAPDMMHELLAALRQLESKGLQVAGVGPSYMDHRQGEAAPFVYLEGLRLKRRAMSSKGSVEADFLIASGCLSPMKSFDAVGTMVEELFIDYVDIEWGLRAREKGYRSYGVFSARMDHSLGDEWTAFRGRRIPVHSPLRHYYHVRNALWLYRRPWLSRRWKLVLLWRVIRQSLFFTFLAPQGMRHARMMALGIWHGLINRMGRY